MIVAPSCLPPTVWSTAAAASINSLSPHLLHATAPRRPAEHIDEALIDGIFKAARDLKHAADREWRGGKSVKALCKHVESAILFMEACEYILRGGRAADHSNR